MRQYAGVSLFFQLFGKDLKIFKFLPQKVLENIRVPKFWGNFRIFPPRETLLKQTKSCV